MLARLYAQRPPPEPSGRVSLLPGDWFRRWPLRAFPGMGYNTLRLSPANSRFGSSGVSVFLAPAHHAVTRIFDSDIASIARASRPVKGIGQTAGPCTSRRHETSRILERTFVTVADCWRRWQQNIRDVSCLPPGPEPYDCRSAGMGTGMV